MTTTFLLSAFFVYFRQRFCPLLSPKQFPAWVRTTTLLMFENCLRVALLSARMRASAPVPGELLTRHKRRVAVPGEGFDPFIFKVSVKSGPPVG